MFKLLKRNLSDVQIEEIIENVKSASADGSNDDVWNLVQPLVRVQAKQKLAALALMDVVNKRHFLHEKSVEVLSQIYEAYITDDEVIVEIGKVLEAARDIDDLNASPPNHPLFNKVVKRLSQIALKTKDEEAEVEIHEGLSSTARLCARQHDEIAEISYARVVELIPETSWAHYNQGLYFKTRARFKEGVKANQKAITLSENPSQAYYWNLGICATGAGEGKTALKIWKDQGQNIEMGKFELPEGSYPSCKVRLAQFPLAERDGENDTPGNEETVWIDRLSPCHGIIRSVLYEDLGINYGDVILFDGAPITYHKYGDEKVAVFPHLFTLKKQHYQFYDFMGTQDQADRLVEISAALDHDAVVYSHSECLQVLCAACWRNEEIQHHHDENETKHIVSGRIAAPQNMNPKTLLEQIDLALSSEPQNRVFSPTLCLAAGLDSRAQIENRRFQMLRSEKL